MNTKDNQRTRLSKLMLKKALMNLLSDKGNIEKITVRELCEKAELNRSTFYAHYGEPKDLLNEIEDELILATEDHLRKIGEENDVGAHHYIVSFLKFIRENDASFRTLLLTAAEPEFKTKFMQQSVIQFVNNLQITLPGNLEQYIFSYILNGSTGIVTQWIRSGYIADESEIAGLLFSINQSALVNLAL